MTDAIRKLAEQIAAVIEDGCPQPYSKGECNSYDECQVCVAEKIIAPILTAALKPLMEALEAEFPEPCQACGAITCNDARRIGCSAHREFEEAAAKRDAALAAFKGGATTPPATDDRLQALLTAATALLSEQFGGHMVAPTKDGGYDLSAYGRLRAAVDAFKGGE